MPRASYPDFGISLDLPDGWAIAATPDFPFLLLAPAERGYRSNLGFSRSEQRHSTADDMENAIAAAHADQKANYEQFAQTDERRFELDGCRAYLQTYTWKPDTAPEPFVQVYGLVLTDHNRLIEINGATLSSLSSRMLPQFELILQSMRIGEGGGEAPT